MTINVESKICPILRAAGFVNGKEMCSEECAWCVRDDEGSEDCAVVVLAKAKAKEANANSIETIDNTLRKGIE